MLKLAIVLAVIAGCKNHLPDTYSGVSGDVSCSWDIIHTERGQCISRGERYRCFRQPREDENGRWTHISCAPFSLFK